MSESRDAFPALELPCDRCGGTGRVKEEDRIYNIYSNTCNACDGHGAVPSPFGEEMLRFLRRYLAVQVR